MCYMHFDVTQAGCCALTALKSMNKILISTFLIPNS